MGDGSGLIKLTVIMTCFNRKDCTLRCINTLNDACARTGGYALWKPEYVVVDDKSTDGTAGALEGLASDRGMEITVLPGTGKLFYTGGMRMGIGYARKNCLSSDWFMLVNDDVSFDSTAVAGMLDSAASKASEAMEARVLVGAVRDDDGNFSYGGVKYVKGINYKAVRPEDADRSCDTFNANCVLMPGGIFRAVPNMDEVYNHSLGDFDYGLSIKRLGYNIEVYQEYIGICNKNSAKGTWNDASLKRAERLRKKEGIKGLPRKEWYHFLQKNFGTGTAVIRSVTPYIRILLGK